MNVLVVYCHPVSDSFTAAVLERCLAGLRSGNHQSRVLDLYANGEQQDLAGVDALVFVYPTWWSGQPALLTQWLQQTASTSSFRDVRRIVAITSHGSPKLTNIVEGEAGRHVLHRALRLRAHSRATTRWIALYDIDTCSADKRSRFLERVERAMSRPRL